MNDEPKRNNAYNVDYTPEEIDTHFPYGTLVFAFYEKKFVCFGNINVTRITLAAICASYDKSYGCANGEQTPYLCAFKVGDQNGVFIAPPTMSMEEIGKYVKASRKSVLEGTYQITPFFLPDHLKPYTPPIDWDIFASYKKYIEARNEQEGKNRADKEEAPAAPKYGSSAKENSQPRKEAPVKKENTKKYELTHITGEKKGRHGFRIRALKDFGYVQKGELGGYIQSEQNLSQEGDCWVFDNAFVVEKARVSGDAIVCDEAIIHDESLVYDNAMVGGESDISGKSRIYENCRLLGRTWVDNSRVHGFAALDGTDIDDESDVYGNVVAGTCIVTHAKLHGNAHPDFEEYISCCDYTEKDDR